MKIKDIVSLQGCYSAHDVGEQEVKLSLDKERVKEIIFNWVEENRYFMMSRGTWSECLVHALVSHSGEIIKKGEQ